MIVVGNILAEIYNLETVSTVNSLIGYIGNYGYSTGWTVAIIGGTAPDVNAYYQDKNKIQILHFSLLSLDLTAMII
jgi:hypothetical protein